MRRILRYSVGNTTPQGFECLRRSIAKSRAIYPEFEIFVLTNQGVRLDFDVDATVVPQDGFLDSLPLKPSPGYNVHWKLYPPRLDINSHEVYIDNDIVFESRFTEIDEFLQREDIFLSYEGRHRSYGRLDQIVPGTLRLNSGIFGLPPGYDFGDELAATIQRHGLSGWKEYFDEQAVVASVLADKSRLVIPQSRLPIVDSYDDIRSVLRDRGVCGIHFVGINRDHHVAFASYVGRPINAVHLCPKSRASFGITQGMLGLGMDVKLASDYVAKGRLVQSASEDIFGDMLSSDLIFVGDVVDHGEFISDHSLWDKVVFYDYRDHTGVQEDAWKRARCYFKRSWFTSDRRRVAPQGVKPLAHCALNEYYTPTRPPKDMDVGCFFDPTNRNIGVRRMNLVSVLQESGLSNSMVGVSTAFGGIARLSIENGRDGNPFYDFLDMQSRCKIVFTAQPEKVDGDNRTWEAFASGALVFRDVSYLPFSDQMLDDVHCVVYDASSHDSILRAVKKAKYYLSHEDERAAIAKAGYDRAIRYHRPSNRVAYMVDTFDSVARLF